MRKLSTIIFTVMTILALSITPYAFGLSENQKPQITKEEATNILKDIIPDVKVLEIRPAQISGLWEIAIETKGQKGIVYVDSSKKYLISGSVINIATKVNVTQERSIELNKVDVSLIPLNDALVMGDKNAKYRVIVFTDPD